METVNTMTENAAKEIYKELSPKMMYQYSKANHPASILGMVTQICHKLFNDSRNLTEYNMSQRFKFVLRGYVPKPKTSLKARFKFLFTGKLTH